MTTTLKTLRIAVCGGRNFQDSTMLFEALDAVVDDYPEAQITLIEGGCAGVDRDACDWAMCFGIPIETYEADWANHGRAAGPLRNQRMINEGRPHMLVAMPGGPGTADMVRRARKANIPVRDYRNGHRASLSVVN